jgi:ABC-type microcin C transport system permease subunit YejB
MTKPRNLVGNQPHALTNQQMTAERIGVADPEDRTDVAYILRRLLLIIPTLVIILLVNFVIVQAAPGGPVEQAIAHLQGIGGGEVGGRQRNHERHSRASRGLDPQLIKDIEKQYGFDKPAPNACG